MFSQVNSLTSTWTPSAATDPPSPVQDAAQVALWTVFDNNGSNTFEIVFDTDDFSATFDVFVNEEDDQGSSTDEEEDDDEEIGMPSWCRTV